MPCGLSEVIRAEITLFRLRHLRLELAIGLRSLQKGMLHGGTLLRDHVGDVGGKLFTKTP